MSKVIRILSVVSLSLCIGAAAPAYAQHGTYNPQTTEEADKTAKPIPKVFSSQVGSAAQAKKLDEVYNALFLSLWNKAIVDMTYQSKLYSLMEPSRFQYTRYAKEFDGDMDKAMTSLKENYKGMMQDIESANKYYEETRENIRGEDLEKLDALWDQKIKEFKTTANNYFSMQNKFLNTYKELVTFVIKQGGSYFYRAGDDRVHFYKFGGYKYYGKSIDALNKTSFDQRQLLRKNAPPNVEIPTLGK